VQRSGIGKRLTVDRAQILHGVIDGADAGREPQWRRRMHGDPRVEHDRARREVGMRVTLLHVARDIGHAGDRRELGAGQRRRHGNDAHREFRRRSAFAPLAAQRVESLRGKDRVGETQLGDLGRVHDRAAADRDEEVGAGITRRAGDARDVLARRMGADAVPDPGEAFAERAAQVGFKRHCRVERAADDGENLACPEPLHFGAQSLLPGKPEHDAVGTRIMVGSRQHRGSPQLRRSSGRVYPPRSITQPGRRAIRRSESGFRFSGPG
jgi:hypothetical protein